MKMASHRYYPLANREPYQRSSSGTGGAAESKNEAGDIQIAVDVDTTTSAPPVVQQRRCSPHNPWFNRRSWPGKRHSHEQSFHRLYPDEPLALLTHS